MHELLRALRRTPDRVLHTRRRGAALANIRARNQPSSVLVLCHGNICRSPFAAAVLDRELAGQGTAVVSAGFIGPGRPSPLEAQLEAQHLGVDLSLHRSQLVTDQLVRNAAVVVAMDAQQARAVVETFGKPRADVVLLGDFDPEPVRTRTIADPIDQPADVYRRVYARIERCAQALASAITETPAPSDRP